MPGAGEVAVFCGALVAAGLGFLWFNAYPAQMFMGDVGSLSLGAALGALALISKQELVLVVAGGVFVAEALSVILQVASYKLRRRRIFRMAPIHHHFELLGWPEPQIIVRFWILSILCALDGAVDAQVAMRQAFAGKKVLIIGARRTGAAVARYLASQGAAVRLSDRSATGFDDERLRLAGADVEWCLGREDVSLLDGVDLVVPSPGVPRNHPLLQTASDRGIEVVAEIELAYRSLNVPLYAVTGTNGKSTTTELLGRMLRRGGRRPFVGGNLGTPLVEAVGASIDCAVVEVSSFQLEWVNELRPAIGVFLNLTDDHLDRYASLDEYGEAKARLFRAQTPEDWAVLSREDRWVWRLRQRLARTGDLVRFRRGRVRHVPAGRNDRRAPSRRWSEGQGVVAQHGAHAAARTPQPRERDGGGDRGSDRRGGARERAGGDRRISRLASSPAAGAREGRRRLGRRFQRYQRGRGREVAGVRGARQ